tara:strand:+ start:40 stop:942 length:903 start_codon:yes stop_codon:yes gene_type:complete
MFKNAVVYRLTQTFTLDGETLHNALSKQSFKPCSGVRPSSFGWIPPVGDEDAPLVHEVAGYFLICARKEEKVVPPSALNEAVAERVERIEATEGRKLPRRDRLALKDDSLAELLPRALPRSKQILGYIAPGEDLAVVGTSNGAEAEQFISCVRDSLGSFPVVLPQVQRNPTELFTHWLNYRKLPEHFTLGEQCDLLDPETSATVTCRRQDLATQEIVSHLNAGKICTRLGLRWYGDLAIAVDKDLSLRQVRFENPENDSDDDAIAQLDAAFVQMALEFKRFLPALYSALGGEHIPEYTEA